MKFVTLLLTGLLTTTSIPYAKNVAMPVHPIISPILSFSVSPKRKAQVRIIKQQKPSMHPESSSQPLISEKATIVEAISESEALTHFPLLSVVDQSDILPDDRMRFDAVLKWLPKACRDSLKHFVVRYPEPDKEDDIERGQATSTSIILRGHMPEQESIAVLAHECAHIIDLGALQGTAKAGASAYPDGNVPIFMDDISIEFYAISWVDHARHHKGSTGQDFVSGYAKYDPFEDFAESFTMYALHNAKFQKLAENNAALSAKYAFMRDRIFGPSFTPSPEKGETDLAYRAWDITKLPHGFTPQWL